MLGYGGWLALPRPIARALQLPASTTKVLEWPIYNQGAAILKIIG